MTRRIPAVCVAVLLVGSAGYSSPSKTATGTQTGSIETTEQSIRPLPLLVPDEPPEFRGEAKPSPPPPSAAMKAFFESKALGSVDFKTPETLQVAIKSQGCVGTDSARARSSGGECQRNGEAQRKNSS